MSAISIPKWTAAGVLPPVDPADPVSPVRSPYRVSLTDFVLRFGTSDERCVVLTGFLKYRDELVKLGVTRGFQWVDGSFLEEVEVLEKRPPNDVDVVTFYHLPTGKNQADLLAANPDLFDPAKVKNNFRADAYTQEMGASPEALIASTAYWYSVWSHRRNQLWKGFVEIDLNPTMDAAASALLATLPSKGSNP